jgi:hypothetical protein
MRLPEVEMLRYCANVSVLSSLSAGVTVILQVVVWEAAEAAAAATRRRGSMQSSATARNTARAMAGAVCHTRKELRTSPAAAVQNTVRYACSWRVLSTWHANFEGCPTPLAKGQTTCQPPKTQNPLSQHPNK